MSAQIEREYQRGVSSARVSLNGHDYDLIFAEMKQRSATQPGKKRPIRRDALPVTRVIRPRTAGDPLVSNTPDADAETTVDTTRPTVEAQAAAASVADPVVRDKNKIRDTAEGGEMESCAHGEKPEAAVQTHTSVAAHAEIAAGFTTGRVSATGGRVTIAGVDTTAATADAPQASVAPKSPTMASFFPSLATGSPSSEPPKRRQLPSTFAPKGGGERKRAAPPVNVVTIEESDSDSPKATEPKKARRGGVTKRATKKAVIEESDSEWEENEAREKAGESDESDSEWEEAPKKKAARKGGSAKTAASKRPKQEVQKGPRKAPKAGPTAGPKAAPKEAPKAAAEDDPISSNTPSTDVEAPSDAPRLDPPPLDAPFDPTVPHEWRLCRKCPRCVAQNNAQIEEMLLELGETEKVRGDKFKSSAYFKGARAVKAETAPIQSGKQVV